MNAPAASDDYVRAVERTFLGLRGGGLVLSPADWDLVCRWQEREIPLEVVLSGIRATFSGRVRVSSRMPLGACGRAVEAAFAAKRAQRAGAAVPRGGGEGAAADRERLVDQLRAWSPAREALADPETAGDLVGAARAAAVKIEQLDEGAGGAPVSAEALQAIESDLLNRLLAALPAASRAEIEHEVQGRLAPYRKRMPESTWNRTFDQAVQRRVGCVLGLDPFIP